MRVNETNLGGGVVRLEVVPTFCGEFIPTHVVDAVMKDFMTRKSRNVERKVEQPTHCKCGCDVRRTNMPWETTNLTPRQREELAWRDTDREPDGIDVHVDRPRQEMFRTRHSWADAMAKYRTLEDAARACDWECREPMKGTIEQPKKTWTCGEQPKKTWYCCEKHVCVDDLVEELLSIVEDLETDCYDSASVADYLRWV
jgi:hypothetical protein